MKKKQPKLKLEKIGFIDVLNKYINVHISVNRIGLKTKRNYLSRVRNITDYLYSINRMDIDLNEIDMNFIEDFGIWMGSGYSVTHISRTQEVCKRALAWAKSRGIISENKLSDLKAKRDKAKEVVHLELNELQKLMYADTEDRAKSIYKDLYIFQALSGLSYGDLQRYRIIKDSQGEWIYCKRGKNQNEFWVPFDSILKEIHLRYNGKLPKVSNRDYNFGIRKVAESLNFNKHLTTHTARKTFATLMYEKGYSIEAIADMMGHTNTETTRKHYLKKSRKRLEMEVKLLHTA